MHGLRTLLLVLPEEPIRPLHDVWLRPRRVFRELATRPIGRVDYLLGAAQGIAGWLALSRAQNAGATSSVAEIFLEGRPDRHAGRIASLFLFCSIYTRLGTRAGRTVGRNQVFHVWPTAACRSPRRSVIWVFTALLAGEVAFEQVPHPEVEGFVALLLRIQFIAYILLTMWSVVIQVMGLSEIQGIVTRKAFGLWVLGQVIAFLALLFLVILIAHAVSGRRGADLIQDSADGLWLSFGRRRTGRRTSADLPVAGGGPAGAPPARFDTPRRLITDRATSAADGVRAAGLARAVGFARAAGLIGAPRFDAVGRFDAADGLARRVSLARAGWRGLAPPAPSFACLAPAWPLSLPLSLPPSMACGLFSGRPSPPAPAASRARRAPQPCRPRPPDVAPKPAFWARQSCRQS